jgi:hypothetical protein
MPTSPLVPIFAVAWASLLTWGWLAAAAAPVLIHLWSRQRYRQVPWAAMQYLVAALRKRQRRMRLEQWLLLALRVAAILLVALARRGPYGERSLFSPLSGGRTHRVLVIDGSYSMAYRPDGKSRFRHAQELAARIVKSSAQGDGFTLLLAATPPRVVVGRPAFEPDQFVDEIDNLRVTPTAVDLPATLAAVQSLIRSAGQESRRLARHEVFFLTDLGRNGWAPGPRPGAAEELRRRAQQLSASANLLVIDVGQPAADNLAVTGLRAEEPVITVAQEVHLLARVKNFGRAAQPRRPLELLIDGQQVQRQSLDLEPGGEKSVTFAYRFETPGDHAVEVRLDAGDRLEDDNRRFLAVPVREFVRVLCVEGPGAEGPSGPAADYLLYALAPRAGEVPHGPVEAQAVHESALLERDLGRYDCVFLRNVAQFTPSEAQVLDAYLRQGGNLVFFLGDRVLAERYNRELGGERAGAPRLLPAALGAVVSNPAQGLNPLDYRHPLVRAFRGRPRAGLLTTPVAKYVKLTLPKNSRAQVALSFADGDPMIVEGPAGRGRVVLVATSADLSWTAMPVWPSFLPLVQELLAYCTGGRLQERNVQVGQPLEGSAAMPAGGVPLVIYRPDAAHEAVRLAAQGDYGAFSYAETNCAGIYTARFGSPVARTQLFAVNLDTAESDLTPLGPDDLRNDVWPGVPFVYQTRWQGPEHTAAGRLAHPGAWHLDLLYAALVLLLAETFLAWRLGYHRS